MPNPPTPQGFTVTPATIRIVPRPHGLADVHWSTDEAKPDRLARDAEVLALYQKHARKGTRACIADSGHFERIRAEDAPAIAAELRRILS